MIRRGRVFQPGTIEAVTRRRKPCRKVRGIAAALLPYQTNGRIDVESSKGISWRPTKLN